MPPTDRVPGGAVARFLEGLDHPRKAEILALRALVLGADPSIAEAIKWNAPSFHTSEHFATMHLRSPSAVQLLLHMGAKKREMPKEVIDDPSGVLEWRGPDRAIVSITHGGQLATAHEALTTLIRQWIRQL